MDNSRKRAGRAERDSVVAHLQAAYSKEYITAPEFHELSSRALECRTMGELDRLTYDLPSVLELEGKAKVPGRFRKFLSGTRQWKHSPWLYVSGVIASLVTGVPLPVLIGNLPVWQPVKYSLVGLCIIIGFCGLIISIAMSEKEFDWM